MKLTTSLSGILCAGSCIGLMASMVLPAWREGIGSKFLNTVPGVNAAATYDERQYGMIYVTGKYRLSWATLARAACDKWTAVYGIAMLQGLIVDDSPCTPNAGEDSDCPHNFANHMMQRCTEYTNIHTATKVLMSMVGIAMLMTLISTFLLFLGSVKANRELIFSLLVFADVCLLVGTVYYVYTSDAGFKVLGTGSTYPYPKLGWSFYFYLACCTLHFTGVMLFGWTKVLSKWVGGGDRPSGWVPPGTRALLAGPQGPGSLPPGPVPAGFSPGGQGAPPGPVPAGMAPAFGPPM